MKKTLALLLAVLMLVGFLPVTAKADDVGVPVYLSVSDDGNYLIDGAGKGIALRKFNVKYFDIGVYGLQNYYYNEHCYDAHDSNPSNQIPGTQATAAGHVTLLHVMIYALEVFYYGNSPTNVGTANHTNIPSSMLDVSGTPGSLYFTSYWGMDENLEYFVNYVCPKAYDGWGRTADQIEIHPNDIISFGHFTDWDFFVDDNGIFTYAVEPADPEVITAETTIYLNNPSNNSVDLIFKHAFADLLMNDTYTTKTPYEEVPVYYCEISSITGDFDVNNSCWSYIGDTDEYGAINISVSDLGSTVGTYVVAIPGQPGSLSSNTCSTPGGIIVNVQ